jgi:hypothetical protein
MRLHGWLLVLLTLAIGSPSLRAAEIGLFNDSEGRLPLIVISGPLKFGDDKKFISIALTLDRALVLLDSPGGNLHAALEIGKAIRLKGFCTYVGDDMVCTAACALTWLAGAPRLLSHHAAVAFSAVADGADGNQMVAAYLDRLDLTAAAKAFLAGSDPNDMAVVTEDKARLYGIAVEFHHNDNAVAAVYGLDPEGAPRYREAPAAGDIRQRSTDFVDRHFTALSSDDSDKALAHLAAVYGERVDYFGATRSRAAVVARNASFIDEWPRRRYRLKAPPADVTCEASICTLTAIVEWSNDNPARRVSTDGTSRIALRIDFTQAEGRIVAEQGTTLQRRTRRQ